MKEEHQLSSGEANLLRQAPTEWTDVPKFAHASETMDRLEKRGLIERRTVPGIGYSKQQWRIKDRRKNGAEPND